MLIQHFQKPVSDSLLHDSPSDTNYTVVQGIQPFQFRKYFTDWESKGYSTGSTRPVPEFTSAA